MKKTFFEAKMQLHNAKIGARSLAVWIIAGTSIAWADTPSVTLKTSVRWSDNSAEVLFVGLNTSGQPLTIDPPGINSSPIIIEKPNGEKLPYVAIVERLKPLTSLPLNGQVQEEITPLDSLNTTSLFEVGVYRLYWVTRVDGKRLQSNEVILYREDNAPKIRLGYEKPIDDPEVAASYIRSGNYAEMQAMYRQGQLVASEGTKQFLFAHPFTLALSVDGTPGIKLNLLATNAASIPLKIPVLGSKDNYLELRTLADGQTLRIPEYEEPENPSLLVGAETKKWTLDVSDFLTDHRITKFGEYQATWIVQGKKVAEFTFEKQAPTEATPLK